VDNNVFYETDNAYSLSLALEHVDPSMDAIIVLDGDILFEFQLLRKLVQSPHDNACIVENGKKIEPEDCKVVVKNGSAASIGKSVPGNSVYTSMIKMSNKLLTEFKQALKEPRARLEWYSEPLNRLLLKFPSAMRVFSNVTTVESAHGGCETERLGHASNRLMAFIRANHALRVILSAFSDLLWLAMAVLPKDKSLWVFGAWYGDIYADNSKYLFEYVNRNHHTIRAVWLTKNRAAYDLVKSRGYEVHFVNSIRGLLLRMFSGVWVISAGIFDVNSYRTWRIGRVKIAQLWHGTPLKKGGFDDPHDINVSQGTGIAQPHVLPFNKRVYDLYIAPSEEVRSKIASAFRVSPKMVKMTGYPRTDALFARDNPKVPITDSVRRLKETYTLGIYLPTHRQEGDTSLTFLLNDLKSVNSRLTELHVILLVKLHFYHLGQLPLLDRSLSNVLFVKDEDIDQDIYTILSETDFLITDYSSIYFDYLLLNKPIIFAPFDIDSYTASDRQLYYDYFDVTPGPKARNWNEVIQCIEAVVRKRDEYEEQRLKVDSIFNAYHDGNSSERVFRAIAAEFLGP
jgi:CDP-glycerol glycerophosphotransferase (TagB/SpsB family)